MALKMVHYTSVLESIHHQIQVHNGGILLGKHGEFPSKQKSRCWGISHVLRDFQHFQVILPVNSPTFSGSSLHLADLPHRPVHLLHGDLGAESHQRDELPRQQGS